MVSIPGHSPLDSVSRSARLVHRSAFETAFSCEKVFDTEDPPLIAVRNSFVYGAYPPGRWDEDGCFLAPRLSQDRSDCFDTLHARHTSLISPQSELTPAHSYSQGSPLSVSEQCSLCASRCCTGELPAATAKQRLSTERVIRLVLRWLRRLLFHDFEAPVPGQVDWNGRARVLTPHPVHHPTPPHCMRRISVPPPLKTKRRYSTNPPFLRSYSRYQQFSPPLVAPPPNDGWTVWHSTPPFSTHARTEECGLMESEDIERGGRPHSKFVGWSFRASRAHKAHQTSLDSGIGVGSIESPSSRVSGKSATSFVG
ncbi:hypothetical protein R3P38DRAFT_3445428 [Favolaschia claudopus]|uniref:Uncharacterized protein n=1 Tax=Favolaschia claudopus TaxID=2862362 RepID=A0AAV9ZNW0_9AGAR